MTVQPTESILIVDFGSQVTQLIARRVLESMKQPMQVDGQALDVGVSIGVGLHHPARSATQVFRLADEALYEAKRRGRNTWSLRRD